MDPEAVPTVERVPHGGVEDPDLLDFSANVNPERPPGVAGVYEAALAAARRYPDDGYGEFRAAAGAYLDCDPDRVLPTPGGLAAVRLTLGAVVAPGDSVLVPRPGFGEYAREVRLQGGEPAFRPHGDLLETDPGPHAAAVVCTPNNPTGEAYPEAALRAFAARCRAAGTVLLVDEAFADFTDRPSLAGEPGTVVARSLTKVFGLPGLRAGFAVARGDLRDRLERARPAWGLGRPAAEVGAHCLRQEEFVAATRRRVERERERLRERLPPGLDARPSEAPFLLLDAQEPGVDAVLEATRERAIAVRDARTFRGLDAHVRVAVRRREENDRLLEALAAA